MPPSYRACRPGRSKAHLPLRDAEHAFRLVSPRMLKDSRGAKKRGCAVTGKCARIRKALRRRRQRPDASPGPHDRMP